MCRIRSTFPLFFGLLAVQFLSHAATSTGLWDLSHLQSPPAYTSDGRTGRLERIYYEGEPFEGRPTRVFAYLGRSFVSERKLPAMVLVHGGGGKAFSEWAEHWARRGYVALAMDLAGNGPEGRLPDGGPGQGDDVKFREFTTETARDMWTYHAVAAVIRGHSLLRSLPEVDPHRVGITGISWGGYLTCLVAGLDPRFRVAVPVYGCGFLDENSVWKDGALARLSPASRTLWVEQFDPSRYLAHVHSPILFLNGTTDFAYPLDSYQKSYRLVPDRYRHLSIVTNLPHGHIWTFGEVDAFVDRSLKGGRPLTRLGPPKVEHERLSVSVADGPKPREAVLCFTTAIGPWQKRRWHTLPADLSGRKISVPLPLSRPLVAYVAVTDERGLRTSSDFVELP